MSEMKITYTMGPDGLNYPNLEMPPQPTEPIGFYGRERQRYLEKNHPGTYFSMLTSCTLKAHLVDINKRAKEMEHLLMEQMKKSEGITEQMLEEDPMKWVGLMNNITHSVREIVMNEVIYI